MGIACPLQPGWVNYVIQPGDTLYGISQQVGLKLADLQRANCLSDPAVIYYGQVIQIPPGRTILINPLPINATPISTTGNATICPNPNIRITSPIAETTFSGPIAFTGSALASDFRSYRLEFRPDTTNDWIQTGRSDSPVVNGYLGRLDPNPSQLPNGGYTIRLTVDTGAGSLAPCQIHLNLSR